MLIRCKKDVTDRRHCFTSLFLFFYPSWTQWWGSPAYKENQTIISLLQDQSHNKKTCHKFISRTTKAHRDQLQAERKSIWELASPVRNKSCHLTAVLINMRGNSITRLTTHHCDQLQKVPSRTIYRISQYKIYLAV